MSTLSPIEELRERVAGLEGKMADMATELGSPRRYDPNRELPDVAGRVANLEASAEKESRRLDEAFRRMGLGRPTNPPRLES